MNVSGSYRIHGPHALQGPHAARSAGQAPAARGPAGADQITISPAAEEAIRASESAGVRADLVARVRAEIANGVYETAAKLDAAVDRLLDEMA